MIERIDLVSVRQLLPVLSALRRQRTLNALLASCMRAGRLPTIPTVEVLLVRDLNFVLSKYTLLCAYA